MWVTTYFILCQCADTSTSLVIMTLSSFLMVNIHSFLKVAQTEFGDGNMKHTRGCESLEKFYEVFQFNLVTDRSCAFIAGEKVRNYF